MTKRYCLPAQVRDLRTETKGEIMTINNARIFVARLKEDHEFRNKVLQTTGPENLVLFLKEESLSFDPRDLVGAMAECMEQLELSQVR